MQLRAGVMLPSGLSELHSCKENVHEASCCGHGKIILIFLIAEYVFKRFDVSVGERQSLKETLAKSIGHKCCDTRKLLKEVSKRENFVFGGGLSEMLLGV